MFKPIKSQAATSWQEFMHGDVAIIVDQDVDVDILEGVSMLSIETNF